MKSKWLIAILAVTLLLCQGLAFAESADDVTAVAEDMVAVDESTNGTVEEAVVADELVAPVAEPAAEATM